LSVLASLMLVGLHEKRWTRVGLCAGVLLSLKAPFALLLVWLGLERRWQALLFAGVGAVCAFGVGWLWVGSQPYVEWAAALGRVPVVDDGFNASWIGLTNRVLSGGIESLFRVIGLGIIAVLTFVRLRVRPEPTTRLVGVSLAAFLLSPIGWVHYLGFLTGPLA